MLVLCAAIASSPAKIDRLCNLPRARVVYDNENEQEGQLMTTHIKGDQTELRPSCAITPALLG